MSSPDSYDPMYQFEAHFPDRFSRTRLAGVPENKAVSKNKKKGNVRRNRNQARYKTQPITFDEIKEVDEEAVEDNVAKKSDIFNKLTAFSRSMDGLLPMKTKVDTASLKSPLTRPKQKIAPLATHEEGSAMKNIGIDPNTDPLHLTSNTTTATENTAPDADASSFSNMTSADITDRLSSSAITAHENKLGLPKSESDGALDEYIDKNANSSGKPEDITVKEAQIPPNT